MYNVILQMMGNQCKYVVHFIKFYSCWHMHLCYLHGLLLAYIEEQTRSTTIYTTSILLDLLWFVYS